MGESRNQGIKKGTGKNVSEHVMQILDKDIKDHECKNTDGNTLKEISFNSFDKTDCKKTQ